ncbi:ABC transporter transmembrane domain-containing protein [Staphylococcus felis]|uniref:ABC transporter transmembrane domain-containing protein n=1 Tax=Staphylococcus felis TaxID=46127 RepID=UPI00374CB3C3
MKIEKTKDPIPFQFENQKNNTIKKFIKVSFLPLSFIFILSILFVILTVLSSFFFKVVVDYIIPHNLDDFLNVLCLIFIFSEIIRIFFDMSRNFMIIKLSIKIDKIISSEYFSKVINLPFIFFTNRKSGEIISRFNDSIFIRNIISTTFVSSIMNSIIVLIWFCCKVEFIV